MSNPVDQGANGAGRFWESYGAARAAPERTRGPARLPGAPGPEANHDQSPPTGRGHECLDWCPICRGAEALRGDGPAELRGQLQTVQRDSLVMLRALIDSYLQRIPTDPGAEASPGVEDIPIG